MKSLCGNDPRRHRTSTSRHKNPPTAVGGFLCKTFTFKRKLRFYIVDKRPCAVKISGRTSANTTRRRIYLAF